MQKRYFALAIAILLTAAVVLGIGIYLKYTILEPLGMAQDVGVMEVPFVLLADPGLRQSIEDAKAQLAAPVTDPLEPTSEPTVITEPTEPVTEPPTEPPTEAPTEPPTEATREPPTEPPTEAPTEPPTEPPTQPPTTEPPKQNEPFVPSWSGEPVDVSWYNDALFIGDSRTVGLRDYVRLGSADYFCDVGMSVFNYKNKTLSDVGFSPRSLEALLLSKQYGKVLICLGINECGYPQDSLIRAYAELVAMVRQLQPDATIVLQGIMTVGYKKAHSEWYFHPSNLFAINARIAAMADNVHIYYIDVNTAFADSNGYLPDELSGDGTHLYVKCYPYWVDWISCTVNQLGI